MVAWPGIHVVGADCGIGRGLHFGTRQIVHLHSAEEAELCLSPGAVERLRQVLEDSGKVVVRPGGTWVLVRLMGESDIALVLALASVAIKAQAEDGGSGDRPPCGIASDPQGRFRRMSDLLPGRWPVRPADLSREFL